MGVFFSIYFVLMSLGPPLAGWLYDASRDSFVSLQFGVVLFFGAALAFALFGWLRQRQQRASAFTTNALPPAT
jgi:MFS family permease